MNLQSFYLAAIAALLCACGGANEVARNTLAVAATGVHAIDVEEAQLYEQAARDALAASHTLAEYNVAMADHNALVDALAVSHSALLAVEASLDASDAQSIGSAVACLLGALSSLQDAVRVAGLEVPDALSSAIALASGFAGVCHE